MHGCLIVCIFDVVNVSVSLLVLVCVCVCVFVCECVCVCLFVCDCLCACACVCLLVWSDELYRLLYARERKRERERESARVGARVCACEIECVGECGVMCVVKTCGTQRVRVCARVRLFLCMCVFRRILYDTLVTHQPLPPPLVSDGPHQDVHDWSSRALRAHEPNK